MTKPHGVDRAGRPMDLIGQPLTPGIGSTPAVVVIEKEDALMAKAEQDGVYRLGKGHFKVRKGDVLPEGAELIEARAKQAAPENKAKAAPVENRAKADKKADD